jgi:hypothetical protein
MQYMLLIHMDEAAMANAPPDAAFKMNETYMAYNEALTKAGAWVGGERLKPSSATTVVKVRDGKTEVLDGPFADTKEQLGGYYVIEAADLDAALEWAAKCPGAQNGVVEVRPIWPSH